MDIKFIEQSHEILAYSWDDCPVDDEETPVGLIASVARTCYKSERRKLPGWDSPDSYVRHDACVDADEMLVESLRNSGHHAMLEFGWLAVRFKTSIGVSRELIRHRLLSFAEQSTRYCNYDKKGFEFVMPPCDASDAGAVGEVCRLAADAYSYLIESGAKPEIARSVLPLCTATTICAGGNLREWRHVFELRTSKRAHPEIRALMLPLLEELKQLVPVVFDDIDPEE